MAPIRWGSVRHLILRKQLLAQIAQVRLNRHPCPAAVFDGGDPSCGERLTDDHYSRNHSKDTEED